MSNNIKRPDAATVVVENTQPNQDTVDVGGYSLPLRVLQEIYEEITEKPQSTGRFYDGYIQVKFDDIEQLNIKIVQTCKQFNIKTFNTTFTIFYLDDTRDIFNNFPDFLKHNAGSASAVETVLIKYNLLIIDPNTHKPQSYNISIRIVSQLTAKKRFERNFVGAPPTVMRLVGLNKTIDVEIEYIEYVVARSLLALIEDWYKVLPCATQVETIKIIQSKSHWIPRLVKLGTTIFVTALIVDKLPGLLAGKQDLLLFGQIFAWASLGVFFAYTVAGWFSRMVELAIDHWTPLSYIKLNKGDEAEIRANEDTNRRNIYKGIFGVIGAVGVELICKLLAELITQ